MRHKTAAACKAVIFDLDGVIVSTDRYHYRAWKTLADELAIPFTETDNHRLRGVSRAESLEIVLERYPHPVSAQEKRRLAEKKNTTYRQLLSRMGPGDLAPAVACTLNALRARGYLLAIGSSSKNAPYILEQIGLGAYFDAVIDGNQITRSKPEPEVFLRAAAQLGLPPKNCWVVEDAEAGLEAARRAGMRCAGIGGASSCALAHKHITHFSELLSFL